MLLMVIRIQTIRRKIPKKFTLLIDNRMGASKEEREREKSFKRIYDAITKVRVDP